MLIFVHKYPYIGTYQKQYSWISMFCPHGEISCLPFILLHVLKINHNKVNCMHCAYLSTSLISSCYSHRTSHSHLFHTHILISCLL